MAVEVWAYVEGEIDGRDEAEGATDEVGIGERGVLRDDATDDESEANADIPRCEVGRIGSATLIVFGKVDKESVVGREDYAKSSADE